ncbi:MAG TPA: bifunctional hydroxymethylpyrimidine kinase/phosphomethylpyrimidine kinase, partial [Opitutaceae bacterium]|nr:bifunctional hydroxymethylpyrimidine kinase/phosphomethylpyrimidine kinase [Opitutaceae bacterium]
MKSPYCVLTIAGSDSGAGAGVQADARTIHALGAYACTAITAVTAQNTRGVVAWRAEPPEMIAAQIDAVLADFRVAAIKTGLLPGAAAVRAVARALAGHRKIPL